MDEKLLLIAEEIIAYADGCFYLEQPEAYDNLTLEEKSKVDDLVFEQIGNCDHCGWHFNYENLETVGDHGELCGSCAGNVEDEDESDED